MSGPRLVDPSTITERIVDGDCSPYVPRVDLKLTSGPLLRKVVVHGDGGIVDTPRTKGSTVRAAIEALVERRSAQSRLTVWTRYQPTSDEPDHGVYQIGPGARVVVYWPPVPTARRVLTGREIVVPGDVREMESGDMVILPPGSVYATRPAAEMLAISPDVLRFSRPVVTVGA